MSVLVTGMEMPKNCHSCPMCLMRFCQAGDRELSEREARPNAKRPSDCPLVPVPPHGDLIDRDAMIRDIQKSLAPSWYIKERNADMVKFLSLEDTIIPADPAEEET